MKTDTNLNEIEQKQLRNIAVLQEHYKPIWAKIKLKVEQIKSPLAKIIYLENEYHNYMEVVISTPELLNASGDFISTYTPMQIGMDGLIENEIKWVRLKYGIRENINPNIDKQQPNNSFNYKHSDIIESIFNRLKSKNYLSDEIKLPAFKRIFNETPIKDIIPINWQGSIASLRYFIYLFPIEMQNVKKWQITAKCFTCNGKEIIPSQIKTAKQISKKDTENIDYFAIHYFSTK